MWSQFAAGGPPPPDGGFPPPPPPPSQPTQAQQGGGFPPPPPQNFASQQEENFYESDNDSDEGGLGMTVNMVTSAASMLFSAARPLANPPPDFDPPQANANEPPKFAPPPPAPIEQFASMLDDDNEEEEEGMTEVDMNEGTDSAPPTTAAPAPTPVVSAATEAAMVFDRPPTPTPPLETPSAFTALPIRGSLGGGPPPPSPKPYAAKLGFPPPSPKGFVAPPAFGRPPTPPVDAHEVFARPPTPTQSAPPTPTQSAPNANPFSVPPPQDAVNVFAQPPTPTQQVNPFAEAPPVETAAQNPFSMPPPTPPTVTQQQQRFPPPATPNPPPQAAVFEQPPPTPQENIFSQPSSTPNLPAPTQDNVFSQPPPTPNPPAPAQENVFMQPPPTPNPPAPAQENVFSQPPPTPETPAFAPPVFDKPPPQNEMFSQPPPAPVLPQQPPQEEQALETLDVVNSETTAPLHSVTPPVSPRKTLDNSGSIEADPPKATVTLTPVINNESKTSSETATAANAVPEASSKTSSLPPVATPSPLRIRSKLRGPPPRSSVPTTTRARSRFKLPTPRRSRSRTPVRGSASKTARSASGRLSLPTPKGKEKLFSSPMEKKIHQGPNSADSTEPPTTPIATNVSNTSKATAAAFSTPSIDQSLATEEPKPSEPVPLVEETKELSPEKTADILPEATKTNEEESPENTENLPEGWSEAIDPTTQQIYFYNSVTGQTAWERPAMKGAPAQEDIQNNEVENTVDENDTVEIPPADETDSSSLPEGWEEATDPTTQQIYYFNSLSGETAWERPTKEVPSAQPAEEPEIAAEKIGNEDSFAEEDETSSVAAVIHEAADENVTSDLPEGWEEAMDPMTEKVYYYNSISGETVWERPSTKVSPESPPTEPEIAGEATETDNSLPENESSNLVAEEVDTDVSPVSEQEPSSLPDGWEEAIDPTTKLVYFYNSLTGETEWERPTVPTASNTEAIDETPELVAAETPQTEAIVSVEEDDAKAGISAEETSDVVTDALPKDWLESIDDEGQVYYYNTQTGQTSWKRPAETAIETTGDVKPSDDQVMEPEPEKTPPVDNVTPPISEIETPENEIEPAERSEETSNANDLPDGWIEATDPVSGNPYFYHSESGTVSWERPSTVNEENDAEQEEEDSDNDIDLEPEIVMNEDDAETDDDDLPEDTRPLPEGWIESFDPQTKNKYYYNSVTGDVSWERPDASQEGEEAIDETAETEEGDETTEDDLAPEIETQTLDSEHNDPLPEGWMEDRDPKTNQVYYYNTFNADVSWERPRALPPSEDKIEEETSVPVEATTDPSENEPELSSEAADIDNSLPGEWEEVDDPSTGQIYFYNRTTGETSWERPTGVEQEVEEEREEGELDIDLAPAAAQEEEEKLGDANQATSSEVPSIDETLDALISDFGVEEPESKQEDAPSPSAEEVDEEHEEEDVLPEGWVAELDPSSGQKYYYNTISGETSWEKPEEKATGDETPIDMDSMIEQEVEADSNTPESTEDHLLEDKKDDGAEKFVEGEHENVEAKELDEPDSAAEHSTLPSDWEEVEDPTNGTYYFNSVTGETSWERPTDEVEGDGEEVDNSAEKEVEADVVEEDGNSIIGADIDIDIDEDENVSDEWVESTDPTSGNIYYYNSKTGETSWEKPASMHISELPEESSPEDDDAKESSIESKDVEPVSNDNTSALPEGWSEVLDATTGEVSYYQNNVTNAITFTKPMVSEETTNEAEGDQMQLPADEDQQQEANHDEHGDGEANDALPEGWTEVEDPSSGQVYYFNSLTDESTWERPTATESSSEIEAADGGDSQVDPLPEGEVGSETEVEVDGGSQADPLPEGWVESEDPDSGNIYYYHEESGEVSWERPTAGLTETSQQVLPSVETQELEEEVAISQEQIDPAEEITDEAIPENEDLPENWVESTDPSSGKRYFYNVITDEVSWEIPTNEPSETEGGTTKEDGAMSTEQNEQLLEVDAVVQEDANAEPQSVDDLPCADLPEGWEEVADPTTGDVYYFNSESGETSWDRPQSAEDFSKEDTTKQPADAEEIEDVAIDNVDNEANGKTEIPVSALSDDWEEVEDSTTGDIYYFNSKTGETSWERPEREGNGDAEVVSPDVVDDVGDHDDDKNENNDDLPEGWEEVEDSSSGETYFYHAESGETSWERPCSKQNAEVEQHPQEDADPEIDNSEDRSAVVESKDVDENNFDDLPDGWEQVEDTSSGEVYFYHAESGDTSWERPVVSDASGEDDAGVVQEDNDADDNRDASEELPEGWKEVEDPSTGDVYYFHEDSGETSWERPVVTLNGEVTDAAEENALVSPEIEDETGVEPNSPGENDDEVAECLPEGWEEVEDPSSGEIYFYHAESGETSWERPEIETEEEQPEMDVAENDDNGLTQEIVDGEQKDETDTGDLPDGWEEVEDSSSGEVYYFNTISGETSWEKPTPEEPNILEQDDGEEDGQDLQNIQNDDDEGMDSNDVGDALPEDWEEMEDPTSGEIYYYNAQSGETSWEKPRKEESEVDAPMSHPEDAGSETEVNEDGESHADPLPEGWVESEDPNSGNIYFYHEESGEVSWERPTAGLTDTSEEITFEPKLPGGDDELPDGWIESVDPDSGDVYYYHDESGDMSWEKPTAGRTNQEIAETEEKEIVENENGDADELPDGWILTEDPSSGEMYYYHAESGETSWERPGTTVQNKESLELSVVAEEEDGEETNPIAIEASEANGESPVPSSLPEFWEEIKDPATGEIYYFNSSTEETSWERPALDETSATKDSLGAEAGENTDEDVDHEDEGNDDVSTSNQELPLPEDWVESTDAASGEIYYYNVKTEETSWERPVGSPVKESNDQDDVVIEPTETAIEDEASMENDVGLDEAESEILDDWVEVNDPSGDKPYYYNSKTGETSWEKPEKEEVNTTHDDDAGDSSAQDELLEGWVEVVDQTSGECYWYNEETQESTWDKPCKSKASDDDVLTTDDEHANVDKNIRDDWVDVQDEMPEENSSELEDDSKMKSLLPDGWVKNFDPSSGDVYYYNEITNETSWDPPAEMNEPNGSSDVAAPETSEVFPGPESTTANGDGSIFDREEERKKHNVFGPLTLCDDSVVTDYIMSKAQSRDILWQLIAIAVQSKGRLRSDYGVVDRSGPEAAIVKLLLSSSDYATNTKTSKNDIVIEEEIDGVREEKDSIVKVQDLLIRGDRERAIEEAMLIGDYATALLVASMCDPDTYKRVAQKYAESRFRSDSPMYTTTMLFSGKIEAPSRRTSGNWGVNPGEVKKNWKSHLASIINNRTFGWDKIVLSLGDRLNEIGCIQEAHFCYMVCGYPMTSPTDDETRVALLGCNHSDPLNRALDTQEALAAFERTEAYEWAKRLGNQYAYFATFQPFKLIYAMILADEGDLGQAQKFVQSIQISPDAARTAASAIKEVYVDQMFDDDVAFELAYNEIAQHLIKGGFGSKYKDSLLTGGVLEITLSKGHTVPRSVKISDPLPSFHSRGFESDDRDPALDATFMTAKSNLMDVSGYTVDEKTPAKPAPVTMNQPPAIAEEREPTEEKKQEQPMPVAQPPKAQERPKASPATAPAVMSGKKKEEKKKPSTPAPASSGKRRKAPGSGAFGGMKSWIIKKLNPDAKEIHLPEDEGQAYYDKELKRWIFPGDDPAELAKPMAPPPMAIKKEEEKPKEDDKPKDAASMLMAPPPSRGLSAKKRLPVGASSPMMDMMMPPGGGPPRMMSPMAPGAGFATPKVGTFTPKAAVFTPKPAAKNGEDE